MAGRLFVGLMSGTSLDGVDAVLVRLNQDKTPCIELLATYCEPMPAELRNRVLALCAPANNEIDRLGDLDVDLACLFSHAVMRVLETGLVKAGEVSGIGSHGQTIRHRPSARNPFTLQIGDPNTIAELTGITTVADFRRRDMAAGGQGAPLVPAFHAAMFRSATDDRAVVNIGGMANMTLLPAVPSEPVRGFDTGPGNVLLDAWHQRHRGTPVDHGGDWAASGQVDNDLLTNLMSDAFFSAPPPKSTGREMFHLDWIDSRLANYGKHVSPVDVQATLSELTARSIADAVLRWGGKLTQIYLCGGGTHNADLCARITHNLPSTQIESTAALGIHPDWVEAIAFAWLAQRTLANLPGNLPEVTGARVPVVLGGIYPGRLQTCT